MKYNFCPMGAGWEAYNMGQKLHCVAKRNSISKDKTFTDFQGLGSFALISTAQAWNMEY